VSPDPSPLRAGRTARLHAAMEAAGHDALVLTSAAAIRYATGAVVRHGESSLEAARPFASVVTADRVHVLGVEPEGVPPEVEHLPWTRHAVVSTLAEVLHGARTIGVERLPTAVGLELERAFRMEPAEPVLGAARAVKTVEEIALLRAAQRASEAGIAEVLPAIVPGIREVDLGARFLAAMARRDVTACHVEPIFCVLPREAREAPWTFAGGLPYRELPGERVLVAGDQVMIDTGMLHAGYLADFGCTWVCGAEPGRADRTLRARWQAILDAVLDACRPGTTAADLRAAALAANGPGRPAPWPRPLYLAHGIGLGGVEPPFVGTDLGLAAETRAVLVPGMVLVIEPYAWEEGLGGYRAEQTIVITDDGFAPLSAPPP